MPAMQLTIKHPTRYSTVSQYDDPEFLPGSGQAIAPGAKVQYLAHVPGGMVKVRHKNLDVIIHPHSTEELA